jgi:hypothetical protein
MFGIRELKNRIEITKTTVECPVIGCPYRVERQRNSFKREERFYCPTHRIYISPTTFEYQNDKDNLLWKNPADIALLETIKATKRESRITRDNSEDALTWNVFRFLELSHLLPQLMSSVVQGEHDPMEVIYWSYSQKINGAWPKLNEARKMFGETLQRSSEPDLIAVSDRGLFFIEAKLTATNDTIPNEKRSQTKYLVGGDRWYEKVITKDYEEVAIKAKKYELLRFWLLGSWLAKEMGKEFYLINIVLSERERNIEQQIDPFICQTPSRRFKRITWEEIRTYVADHAPTSIEKSALLAYYKNKSLGYNRFGEIQRAFSPIKKEARLNENNFQTTED